MFGSGRIKESKQVGQLPSASFIELVRLSVRWVGDHTHPAKHRTPHLNDGGRCRGCGTERYVGFDRNLQQLGVGHVARCKPPIRDEWSIIPESRDPVRNWRELGDAGFPDGTFQTLLISSKRVEAVLRDDRVVAVTLTGSGPAGSSVASIAGDAVKKSVLELGGSDPFMVLPSANLARAAEVAATARCLNNGQSCIAAKRFIVHAQVADEFERLFVDQMASRVVGDPMDERTDVGPLASEQQRSDIVELVEDAVGKGATVHCGGAIPDSPGWYYPPTVLTGITAGMRVHREEVFGPVATLYRVATVEEAIELANGTDFGLGANAWTDDRAERGRLISELDAGMVFINGNVTSYPGTAVRRGQGVGLRARADGPRDPRVLQPPVRLGWRGLLTNARSLQGLPPPHPRT